MYYSDYAIYFILQFIFYATHFLKSQLYLQKISEVDDELCMIFIIHAVVSIQKQIWNKNLRLLQYVKSVLLIFMSA